MIIKVSDKDKVYISESSSKGNQLKFYKDNYWIKTDNARNEEGLAEEFVSLFLGCIYNFPHVNYKSILVDYDGELYNGCICENMYNKDISFISLRRLYKQNNIPLNIFIKEVSVEQNISNVLRTTEQITSLDLTQYFFRLIFLDALIINEDRHYMNLGVCTDNKQFFESLCFDNGASLFCTNWTYRKTKSLEENLVAAKSVARPFSKFFDKQVQACLNLGANPLVIDKNKVNFLLQNYDNKLYSDEKIQLIKTVLINRLNYYKGKGVYIYV